MGLTPPTDLRNCVRLIFNGKNGEQYDSNGNIIYYYKREFVPLENTILIIYNVDQKEVGRIKKNFEGDFCSSKVTFTFIDENNTIIKYIEIILGCAYIFRFYDTNKNLESVVTTKKTCKFLYEESDIYNTIINRAGHNIDCDCNTTTFTEYDQFGSISYITKIFNTCDSTIIKIFDHNYNEVNISDKTLANKGFTKIQIVILLRIMFRKF